MDALADTVTDVPPYALHLPDPQTLPVVLASPHSGRHYPAAFLKASRLDALAIRGSEDSFVDDLFADAPSLGAPLLCATFPRAFVDANREAWELDPAMFADPLPSHANTRSPRVIAGLGSIPRIITGGVEIYRGKLPLAEAERRLNGCYAPYHAALDSLISRTVRRFGVCIFIDCHSMPSLDTPGRCGLDMVIGDCHGASCDRALSLFICAWLEERGYRVGRNNPYAGGYCTQHYGRPSQGVHALQIEISRALYMDEQRIAPAEGFGLLRRRLHGLVGALAGFDMSGLNESSAVPSGTPHAP